MHNFKTILSFTVLLILQKQRKVSFSLEYTKPCLCILINILSLHIVSSVNFLLYPVYVYFQVCDVCILLCRIHTHFVILYCFNIERFNFEYLVILHLLKAPNGFPYEYYTCYSMNNLMLRLLIFKIAIVYIHCKD